MIGIGLEVESECLQCGRIVPANALVPELTCSLCGEAVELGASDWKNYLRSHLYRAVYMGVGDTFEQRYSHGYTVRSVRLEPTFGDLTTPIPRDDVVKGADQGYLADPNGGRPYSVRRADTYVSELFAGVSYLVGEDFDCLSNGSDLAQVGLKASSEAEAFKCLGCGGDMTVDAKSRFVKCGYCGAESYLPDQIWKRLKPFDTVMRWYFLYDESLEELRWDLRHDATADDAGSVYYVAQATNYDLKVWYVASFDSSGERRWLHALHPPKADEPEEEAHENGAADVHEPWMTWTHDGLLRVECDHGVGFLSPDDGQSVIQEDEWLESPYPRIRQYRCWAPDPKGGIIAVDEAQNDAGEPLETLSRFDSSGKSTQPWQGTRQPKQSVWSKIGRKLLDRQGPLTLADLRLAPETWARCDAQVSVGFDGHVYLVSEDTLFKYSPDGHRKYVYRSPDSRIDGAAAGDKHGRAYVLLNSYPWRILRIAADGKQVEEWLSSVRHWPDRKWSLDRWFVTPDGTVITIGGGVFLMVVDPQGETATKLGPDVAD